MGYNEFIAKLIHLDAGDECPIQVAAAILKPDERGKTRLVSGRGVTAEEAEKRCIAEAAERHAAIFNASSAITCASLDALGLSAIDPRSILLISDRQYEMALAWNPAVDPDHRLPAKFDPKAKIGWAVAHYATARESVHVPAAHVFLGYPHAVAEGFPVPDSNGLAAGRSISSAQERAVLELVERDAVAIWWYAKAQRPELDFEPVSIPWFGAFADWIGRTQRKFWILDLGHDFGIPVAAAISCNDHGRDLSFGFAAGRSRAKAAASALGELVQFDLTKRLQRGQTALPPAHFLTWCGDATIKDNAFLRPDPKMPAFSLDTSADPFEALTVSGLTPLFADLSPAAGDMHVVRAIVPGLRPIWPRFAPGRLYDIPFKLGWLDYRLMESELNPISILY